MAAPVDAGRATTTVASSATPAFNLPSSIAAGDLLIVAFRSGAAIVNRDLPAGWAWSRAPDSPDSSDDYIGVMWKVATGSEGSTVTMPNMGATLNWAALSWRITGAGIPESSTLGNQGGPSSAPNPPSLTPHGGSRDYLWIAIGSAEDNNQSFTTAPTNYSNGIGIVTATTGAPGCSIVGATRQLTASSEDPGAFATGGSSNSMTNVTIAVPPPPVGKFPTDTGPVTTAVSADSTPTFNLPSGVQNGDVLIVAWRATSTLSSPNALPSGWTTLVASASGDGSGDHAGAMWKRADGTEGSNVTMADFGTAANFAAVAWRIKGAKDPVATTMLSEVSSTVDLDPPSLDPTGGAKNFLWLTWASAEDACVAIAAPSGYEKLAGITVSSGASGTGVGGATRQLNADSEDPPAFWMNNLRRMSFTAAMEVDTHAVISQLPVEVVLSPTSAKARFSQQAVEVVLSPTSAKARFSQIIAEALLAPVSPIVKVKGAASYVNESGGGAQSVTLPQNISNGDLLLMFCRDSYGGAGAPSGWSTLVNSGGSTDDTAAVFYKIASGSEGATVSVTSNGRFAAITKRIIGHDPAAPVYASSLTSGVSTTPDSPALAPAPGSREYLWIPFYSWTSNATTTGTPGSTDGDTFTNRMQANMVTGASDRCCVSTWSLNKLDNSLDPTSVTISNAEHIMCWTVAVNPLVSTGKGFDVVVIT